MKTELFTQTARLNLTEKNKFAEITATGTWSLHGKKLTITAIFENTMYNGDKVTVNNILKYTV